MPTITQLVSSGVGSQARQSGSGVTFFVYVTAVLVMELVAWTCARILDQIETPYHDWEGSFSTQIPTTNK